MNDSYDHTRLKQLKGANAIPNYYETNLPVWYYLIVCTDDIRWRFRCDYNECQSTFKEGQWPERRRLECGLQHIHRLIPSWWRLVRLEPIFVRRLVPGLRYGQRVVWHRKFARLMVQGGANRDSDGQSSYVQSDNHGTPFNVVIRNWVLRCS